MEEGSWSSKALSSQYDISRREYFEVKRYIPIGNSEAVGGQDGAVSMDEDGLDA